MRWRNFLAKKNILELALCGTLLRLAMASSDSGDYLLGGSVPDGILEELTAAGVLREGPTEIVALSGGVSSEIWVVRQGERSVVVKQALERLRVAGEWWCDPARNENERHYLDEAARIVPGLTPRVLHAGTGYFVMEHLGEGWENWKARLLAGDVEVAWGTRAGQALARMHHGSRGNARLREKFATGALFHDLRIHPYFLTAAEKNPRLAPHFLAEAERLKGASVALVHGDFSPKNLLLHPATERIVLLDCEVAWYGDPAFDVAFLLSHLFLKGLNRPESSAGYAAVARAFLDAYRADVPDSTADAAPLLLLLLVARVDGKSPVEYLVGKSPEHRLIREFAAHHLAQRTRSLADLSRLWPDAISSL